MADCVFCKIINNEIPSTRVYEDERVIAIRDLSPQAPEHILLLLMAQTSTEATSHILLLPLIMLLRLHKLVIPFISDKEYIIF